MAELLETEKEYVNKLEKLVNVCYKILYNNNNNYYYWIIHC